MSDKHKPRQSRRDQFVTPPSRKGGIPVAPLVTLAVIVLAAVVYRVGFYEEATPAATAAPLAHSTAEAPPLRRAGAALPVDRPRRRPCGRAVRRRAGTVLHLRLERRRHGEVLRHEERRRRDPGRLRCL